MVPNPNNAAPASVAFRKAIGRHIRELRLERGWSQMEMAELLRTGSSAIGRLERGNEGHGIMLQTLFDVCEVLGLEFAVGLGGRIVRMGDCTSARVVDEE